MVIADRLRALREQKNLSPGDVEKRTGFLCCYRSRVENGHTVPAIETLDKFARALEIPPYQLFYDGETAPKLPNLPKGKTGNDIAWASSGRDAKILGQFRMHLSRAEEKDLRILLFVTQKMAWPLRAKP